MSVRTRRLGRLLQPGVPPGGGFAPCAAGFCYKTPIVNPFCYFDSQSDTPVTLIDVKWTGNWRRDGELSLPSLAPPPPRSCGPRRPGPRPPRFRTAKHEANRANKNARLDALLDVIFSPSGDDERVVQPASLLDMEQPLQLTGQPSEGRIVWSAMASTCDPYLCLVVELLGVDIRHRYNGHEILYTFARSGRAPVRTLRFMSDRGHFWCP